MKWPEIALCAISGHGRRATGLRCFIFFRACADFEHCMVDEFHAVQKSRALKRDAAQLDVEQIGHDDHYSKAR